MSDVAIPLREFDAEMSSTRRLLERIPFERAEWRPHEKSFPMGHLAQLVAWMPGWIASTLNEPSMDIMSGGEGRGYSFERTETLVALFDENVRNARTALANVTGASLDETWSLTMGERTLMAMPKREAVRQHMNHFCHHRGQLTVYARLVDVPVPMIYGPTADERWGG
jgi:uncharacterized damage-inducible protein DinB